MFQSDKTSCLCGCNAEFVFRFDEEVSPAHGERLAYKCPNSKVVMSFGSRGHWGNTIPEGKHQVVQVSRGK
jgi:hypothetical protein